MTVGAPSKLPLWRTIGRAYAVWARNFPDLARTCWLWMLLMAPVLAIWLWWQERHVADIMQAAARAGQPFADPNPLLTMVMGIVRRVVMLPALASVAVAWHRLMLSDEHPGPGVYLRLDRTVAGYAILAFCIGVITLAPSYVGMLTQIITGRNVPMAWGSGQPRIGHRLVHFGAAIACVAGNSVGAARHHTRRRLEDQQT